MKKRWALIGAATLLAGFVTAGTGQAVAGGYTSFSIGTTFGGGGYYGHGRSHFDDDDDGYRRGYRGYGHGYDRGYYGRGSRSNISIGLSTVFTGDPYYSGYYASPYPYYPYSVQQPVYVAPPVYYAPPAYDSGYRQNNYVAPSSRYQQSSYVAPAADSCLQTREYQTHINIGGHRVPGYGTACLQADGSWKEGPAQPEQ